MLSYIFYRCARQGAEAEVRRIQRKCLNDDTSQCNDLGEAAASSIAQRFCPNPESRSARSASGRVDYAEECRELGVEICRGSVSGAIRRVSMHLLLSYVYSFFFFWSCTYSYIASLFLLQRCGTSPNRSTLRTQMNMCEDEVNALLGRRPSPPTPNRRPTPRPNRRVSMHLLGLSCVYSFFVSNCAYILLLYS